MRINNLARLLVLLLLLSSCGTAKKSIIDNYPKFKEESPVSILILPPINETNHADAKDMMYSSLLTPFADKGFYVFPPLLTMDLLRQESAQDAEPYLDNSVKIFNKTLDADAVLFTVIKKWDKDALGGYIHVDIEYILRSAKSDEILYKHSQIGEVDTRIMNSDAGLFSFVSIIANAISTALSDKIEAARNANNLMIQTFPPGKYLQQKE